ncbi:unnamed protein product [Rotaria sp. Silwood1]|nr:unnamed protein product [Rotaria sp. Silwood1]
MFSWRPLNTTPSGSSVDIQIRQRYSWNRASVFCDDTYIASLTQIGDNTSISCVSGTCSTWNSNLIYTKTYCTDYSVGSSVSSGEIYYTRTVPLNIAFSIAFASGNWFANLVVGANGLWSVIDRINTIVRPDGYLNNSPVATTLPVIYKVINTQHVHVVQMSDLDSTDTLKCRWSDNSTSNFNSYDECADVCNGVPGAVLYSNNCTIVFTLTLANMYVAVALQIEDYYTSTSSTPMSSVPLQFLFYGYDTPSGCSTPPAIIGNRPNRACVGTPIGSNVTEYVTVQVYCSGKTITDFVTSSPVGLTKSSIQNPTSGIYQIILSWIPTSDQFGPQGFCAGAIDNTDVQSDQWCITFLVGYDSPNLIQASSVQGTVSPIGTIFANQTIFSIQATRQVNRPSRNYTYVYFNDVATGTSVYTVDCGWDPHVMYSGNTITFYIPSPPWIPGHTYYVTFDSGVASGTDFCKPESSPITEPKFWRFDIWNPAVSSTTTTTTTPPTTGTVTTRPISTTTVNTLLTTTGIVATSTTTVTATTTSVTTSTKTTTETTSTVIVLISTTPVNVMSPKEFEQACTSSLALVNAITMLAIAGLHALFIYGSFLKYSQWFNPNIIEAKKRHRKRLEKNHNV